MRIKELTFIKIIAAVLAIFMAGTAPAPPLIASALVCRTSAKQS